MQLIILGWRNVGRKDRRSAVGANPRLDVCQEQECGPRGQGPLHRWVAEAEQGKDRPLFQNEAFFPTRTHMFLAGPGGIRGLKSTIHRKPESQHSPAEIVYSVISPSNI